MTENGSEEGLLVRAEPLGLAEDISQRMVDVVRVVNGALRVGKGDQSPARVLGAGRCWEPFVS